MKIGLIVFDNQSYDSGSMREPPPMYDRVRRYLRKNYENSITLHIDPNLSRDLIIFSSDKKEGVVTLSDDGPLALSKHQIQLINVNEETYQGLEEMLGKKAQKISLTR